MELLPFSGAEPTCAKCLRIGLDVATHHRRNHENGQEWLLRICDCGFTWQEETADSTGSKLIEVESETEPDDDDPRIGTLLVMLAWVADNPDVWEEMPLPLQIGLRENFPKFEWPEGPGAEEGLSEAQKEMYRGWAEGHGMKFGGPEGG